jgi:flagellar protein FlbD
MIELTRLNGTRIVLNSDLIKTCEASPDTMITLMNGEKLIVREELKQVVQRVQDYRSRLLAAVVEQMQGRISASGSALCDELGSAARADTAARTLQDSVSRD